MTNVQLDDVLARLAAYQYLEELVAGKRVLEIGCGDGLGALQLLALGAEGVVTLGGDVRAARRLLGERPEATVRRWRPPRLAEDDDSFDLVLVPDAVLLEADTALLDEVVRVARPSGRVAVLTASGDHPALDRGLSYGELLDLLEPRFAQVRVVGQSPFVGYSLVELSEEQEREPDVMLDGALMGGGVEEVVVYIALCDQVGAGEEQRPYGILQVPAEGAGALDAWREWAADPDAVAETRAAAEETAAEAAGEAEPRPLPAPAVSSYTDRAGGRLARWRWPVFSRE